MFTRRSGGSSASLYSEELSRNSLIEVGQDLQFRAVVRSGDGWKYAKLKDLTITKISKRTSSDQLDSEGSSLSGRSKKTGSPLVHPDSAYLVMEDGCRNPVYTAIAPKHPLVDSDNPLVVNFAFKAFMFQDMMDGDTLKITAKIIACQEKLDCQPGLCLDDELGGHGKRRRRRRISYETSNSTGIHPQHHNSSNVHDWVKDFELHVVLSRFAHEMKRKEFQPISLMFAASFLTVGLFLTALTIIAVVALILIHDNQDRSMK